MAYNKEILLSFVDSHPDLFDYLKTHSKNETAVHYQISEPLLVRIIKLCKREDLLGHGLNLKFAKTHTPEEYAKAFNVRLSYARTYYRLHDIPYTIKRRKKVDILDSIPREELVNLLENKSMREICNTYNIYSRDLNRYLREHNFDTKYLYKSRKDKLTGTKYDMIKFLATKYSITSIAEVFGCTKQWISQVVLDKQINDKYIADALISKGEINDK